VTVTVMPTETAAFLVAGHLHHLWAQTEDPDWRGCCPECCGPCSALRSLFHRGHLDDLYAAYLALGSGTSELWDPRARRIRRDWLIPAWSVELGCHGEREVES
jgi:hypothetical protein